MQPAITNKDLGGFSLSAAQLKGIGMAAMLIDHFAALCLLFWLEAAGVSPQSDWMQLYLLLRTVGRIAFPIYFFLLVEGFFHTRSPKRYLGRLLLFGLISEIPYDLAYHDRLLESSSQNIFFTFAIGLVTLSLLERYRERPFLRAAALAGGCLIALRLRPEYDMVGILLMTAFYLLRQRPVDRALAAGMVILYETRNCWGSGLWALVPIGCYNGARGNVRHPWFFYWFYPVHIFLLYLLRRAVLGL